MSAAPTVIAAQDCPKHAGCWQGVPLVKQHCDKAFESPPARLMSGDVSSSSDELNMKVRKPYTITKQRERWTENEHQKFLEALKLFGRAWRRIEEHIGTKTAVQIRSHAQKFFSKLEREASNGCPAGKLQDIEIPPPRPKRKPSHPYPRKAGKSPFSMEEGRALMVGDLASPSMKDVSANIGSCQPAAFKPYVGKGGPVLGAGIFHDNTDGLPHFFETEGSLKLFGKTVVVPTSLNAGAQKVSSEVASDKEICSVLLFDEKPSSPSMQTEKQGFSPYVKVGKTLALNSGDTVSSNISVFGSGLSTVEGTGESSVQVSVAADGPSAEKSQEEIHTNTQCISRRKSLLHESSVQELHPRDASIKESFQACMATTSHNETKSNGLCPTILEAGNMGRFFHGLAGSQNNAACPWMDSLSQYYGGLPILPHAACSMDGQSPIPTIPWHFLQAAAVSHPAAYAAAMVAAGWTGLVPGVQAAVGLRQANATDSQGVSPSVDDLRAASEFVAAVTPWWPLRGLESQRCLYTPAGAICSSTDAKFKASGSISTTHVQDIQVLEDTVKQDKEQTLDPEVHDEARSCVELENAEEDECSRRCESRKEDSTLEVTVATKCSLSVSPDPTKISAEDNISLPDYKNRPKVSNSDISMGVPVSVNCPQEVEKDTVRREKTQHSPCSSTDEMDGRKNNLMEGSSSGSNTPIFGHNASELDSPNTSGSDVKEQDTFCKDVTTCSNQHKCSNEDELLNSNGSPKMKVKHSEKGKNHQHKDFRHGDEDHAKRFKSSAHDMDVRKGVSEEGRKAFQALFTCKVLPQTFPSLNAEDKRTFPAILKTMSSASMKDTSIIDAEPASCSPAHKRQSSGCLKKIDAEQEGFTSGEGYISGMVSMSRSSTGIAESETGPCSYHKDDTDESMNCPSLSISKEMHANMAMLGSRSGRSGFVPYKRPLAETKASPKIARAASANKQ